MRGYHSPTDFNFIVSSWLKSYRNSAPAQDISNPVYYTFQAELIESILRDPANICLILSASNDPDQIMGYVIFNTTLPIVHYLYVKQVFRGRGIGALLLKAASNQHPGKTLQCTHVAKKWKIKARAFNLTHNPFLLRYSYGTIPDPQAGSSPASGGPQHPASLV